LAVNINPEVIVEMVFIRLFFEIIVTVSMSIGRLSMDLNANETVG
jgi:hypothetical protein